MALPSEERDLVRHCTLGAEDFDRLREVRAPHNRLGHALLLCAMRHPGRALGPGERPPVAMVSWVARQLGVDADVLSRWSNRAQTRREQISDIMKTHGFMTLNPRERFGEWTALQKRGVRIYIQTPSVSLKGTDHIA